MMRKEIEDLLSIWERRKESGDKISVEVLCSNNPELIEDVRWHIHALQAVESQFGGTAGGSSTDANSASNTYRNRVDQAIQITSEFKIERHHASGGLGDVFLALDPVLKRRVAIKFPRASRLTSEQLARFEREARITSRLDHPGIVAVHSLKQDDPNQPCYVMRFIEGPTLYERAVEIHAKSPTGHSRERLGSMEFRQLLKHFVALCNIVAYAHDQGVIHRDIKPSNVILGPFGETLLMDWGLARIDDEQELAERTGSGDLLRENLLEAISIETRSGQILGTPAYASPEQLLGQLDQVDHRSDVFSLGATLHFLLTGKSPADSTDMAKHLDRIQRQATTLSKLESEVPRPLAAICRKATNPTPSLRYPNALALADDIECFLANEPTSVLPDSFAMRSVRWIRKHPTASVATAVAALLLLVFSALGVTVLSDFNRRLSASNVELEKANNELVLANALEKESRERADANFDSAKGAVEQFLVKVTEDPRVKGSDFTALRKDLLGSAKPFFEKLKDQKPGDPSIESSRAEAFYRLAFIQEQTGQEPLAESNYRECVSIYERLSRDFPSSPQYRIDLSKSHRNLGLVLIKLGNLEEAKSSFQSSLTIRRTLIEEFPGVSSHRNDQVAGHLGLLSVLRKVGDTQGAKEQGVLALSISEQLAAEFPEDPDCRSSLAKSLSSLGMLLNQLGERVVAKAHLEQCVKIRKELASESANDQEQRDYLAKSHQNLGFVLGDLGERKGAIEQYQTALAICQQLSKDFPSISGYEESIGALNQNIGNLLVPLGQRAEALKHHEAATAMYEKLVKKLPSIPSHAVSLAGSYCNLGNYWLQNDQLIAIECFDKAESLLKTVLTKEPRDTQARSFLRNAYGGRASVFNAVSRYREAAEDWRHASEYDEGRNKPFFDEQAALCETMANQEGTFEKILAGEQTELANAEQRVAFALYCHGKKIFLKAAEQYQRALIDQPGLAAANRYNAVCSTALLLASNEPNAALTVEQQSYWRSQALEWLNAEFETLAAKSARSKATLMHWLKDPDLNAVRTDTVLNGFPETDRQLWEAFWLKVRNTVEAQRSNGP